jgi:hypothetical protein
MSSFATQRESPPVFVPVWQFASQPWMSKSPSQIVTAEPGPPDDRRKPNTLQDDFGSIDPKS